MARRAYDEWREVKAELRRLNTVLETDLIELCFEESQDTLKLTQNTQPAVFAASYATYAGIRERFPIDPSYVAGHSLGHITALVAAEALTATDGIRLVRRRGELMKEAAENVGPGEMLAVLLADGELVTDLCSERARVSVAAYNAPRQTVISGESNAVREVRREIESTTRARFVALDVDAAFHSPVMEPAVEPFATAIDEAAVTDADIPIVSDISGKTYTDPATAKRELVEQLTSPIDWTGVVETLKERGVDQYVELPPSGTLANLIEKIHPEAEVIAIDAPADLEGEF